MADECVKKNCNMFYVMYILIKERIQRIPKNERSYFTESQIAPYEEWN